jgi:peptide-methionine (S)-S-oxide reductase
MLFAALFLAGAAQSSAMPLQTAVLAGGCYWGVESVFEHVKGVRDVVSGYAGRNRSGLTRGQGDDPGFAEAVRISFDPGEISYDQLLQIFFDVAHDPTQVDRQGPDVGPRYRSAIFPQNAEQRTAAERALAQLKASGRYRQRIATRLESGGFEPADSNEQDFVRKHPNVPYVLVNDLPKLADLKRKYPQIWRD